VLAASGASLLWGTMYIPYRKAYISGMNPLSFVTVFTIGELGTVLALVLMLDGGTKASVFHSPQTPHLLFWLFLGGFAWVIGDLFQQFAAKYLGIGRGIPLSNTNQLWGLAWGALVFGELAHADPFHKMLVVAGSLVMILGAVAIGTAVAGPAENASANEALLRECHRYHLEYGRALRACAGPDAENGDERRSGWDYAIAAIATGVFVVLGWRAKAPALAMDPVWLTVLAAILVITALVCGWGLWKTTRFS
jgi:hypothetical protein